jgi:tellurite resistance protein TerA
MGIDYTKRPQQPAQPAAPAPSPAAPPAPPSAAPPSGVSLSKVTLTKAAPSVSLTKHGGQRGVLKVNLNWTARPPAQGGFFKKLAQQTQLDLDLGCLYEFADGTKGVVQALGNAFTAADGSGKPLLRLDGDDRTGAVSAGENLSVDLTEPSRIRRILIFALIYEGAANWAAANAIATLQPVGAPPIEVRLDDPRDGARICAIAMISQQNGEVTVQREVNYVNGAQRALDEAYGWGMNWTKGRK